MRLRTISAGIEAPRAPFRGVVHSVFARACNLSVGPRSLATLLTHEQQNLPRAVRVETPDGFDFLALVRAGQAVTCDGDIVRFADAALEIDLHAARRWHIDLASLHCNLTQANAYGAWQAAVSELRATPRNHGFATMLAANGAAPAVNKGPEVIALARRGAPAVAALITTARNCDALRALHAAARLVGLGPGLTPSGDDFLVGFLAGLWSSARSDARRLAFRNAFGSGLSRLADGTGDVSRAYLLSAIAGNFSERLALLAVAIARAAKPPEVRAATRAALAVGATSGADGVIGLLAGIAVCSPRAAAALAALVPRTQR